jgi:hypothetical protein
MVYAPVVQRIERKIADLVIEVRFLTGAPETLNLQLSIFV